MIQTTTPKGLILEAKSERSFFKFATIAALLFTAVFCYIAFQMFIPRLENANQALQGGFIVAYLGIFGSALFAIKCIASYFDYDQDIKRLKNNERRDLIKAKQDFYENIATFIIVICLVAMSFYGFSILQGLNLENSPIKGAVSLTFATPLMILPIAIVHFLIITAKKYKAFLKIQTEII